MFKVEMSINRLVNGDEGRLQRRVYLSNRGVKNNGFKNIFVCFCLFWFFVVFMVSRFLGFNVES